MMKPMAMHNGNRAILQNRLLTEPFALSPTLEKISVKDRRLSHIDRKITRKARITPQFIAIEANKLRTREIVMSCGSVPFEEPLNAIILAKYKVTKSQTMNGPFLSPNFLDAKAFTFSKLYTCLFSLLVEAEDEQRAGVGTKDKNNSGLQVSFSNCVWKICLLSCPVFRFNS